MNYENPDNPDIGAHCIYFYHPDHLGSSHFITDEAGKEYEHTEYTPYGELWVDKKYEN